MSPAASAREGSFGDIAGTIVGRSDDTGHFTCWVPQETEVHLLPFASTLVGHSRFVDATAYHNEELHFAVEHGMRLTFKVTDPIGKPLPGAICTWTGGGSYTGKTDAQGECTIGMVSRTAPHTPVVALQGYHLDHQLSEVIAADYLANPLTVALIPDVGGNPAAAPGQ